MIVDVNELAKQKEEYDARMQWCMDSDLSIKDLNSIIETKKLIEKYSINFDELKEYDYDKEIQ